MFEDEAAKTNQKFGPAPNPFQFDFDDRKEKKQEPETVDDELKLGLNNNVLYDFLL